jgi:uncharacterized repeat protein (TIGR01451 family)
MIVPVGWLSGARRALGPFVLFCALFLAWTLPAFAQSTPIARSVRVTGNINFVTTGGSLRTQSNTDDSCAVGTTSTQNLSGIPAGTSIQAAYLYWGGSGATVDSTVTFAGASVTASRTFTATFTQGTTNYPYFGGVADVTSLVTGNGSYTFGGLTVNNGTPHCGVSAVAAGWGLVVIYAGPSERLRAINIFDGLQFFRGNALTLTPDGFRAPPSNIDGRVAVITWEGDPGNSTPLNGFSESLTFNGNVLDDGINVTGSDPLVQQYDGTINSQGVSTSYGVDVDTYDVSSFISPTQTTATTVYSAGGDLVLLTAQIVSVTTEPVVDLSITKADTGDFAVGSVGSYTLRVSNAAGFEKEDNVITVTDVLPAGLTYQSFAGAGWSCSASGQTVTCTRQPPLLAGASAPDLTINVLVGASAFPSVSNTGSVDSLSRDTITTNDSATDTTDVRRPDLSTSTKTFVDLNGGEANPGDTLRYTISLVETGGTAATGVVVTDDVPANATGFAINSVPAGATDSSTGTGTGAFGNGFVNVTGIAVPANGSVSVVFDVVVPAAATPGTQINNTATIANPNGPGATPIAPQIIVSPSQIPGSGSKPLYFRRLTTGSTLQLSRNPPASGETFEAIPSGQSRMWPLTPALQLPITIPANNISVRVWLSRAGSGTSSRTVTVTLANSVTGTIGTSAQTITPPNSTTPREFQFVIPNSIVRTFPAGSVITATVQQTSTTSNATRLHPNGTPAGQYSRVELNSNTVINVDSVAAFNAPFAGGAVPASFTPGSTAYLRSVISDPFGSFDIASASVTLLNPSNGTVLNNVAMTQVADSGTSTRTYETAFAIPANAPNGTWQIRVTGVEGTEAIVTDLGAGTFVVSPLLPQLRVQKTSEVLSDPVNATTNPKRIPGAVIRYSISVTNTGQGVVDSSSLVITDAVPANTALFVGTGAGNPIEFIDGTVPSGLNYNYATNVTYSNQPSGGPPYTYTPVPDVNGFDAAVRGFRVAPTDEMDPASGANQPSFTIRVRVRVQ